MAQEVALLQDLKRLIRESNNRNIQGVLNDDALLLKFLRGRKYDPRQAFETLEYHLKIRFERYADLFSNLKPSLLAKCLQSGLMGTLKERDPVGRKVLFSRINRWDVDEVEADDTMKSSILFIEEMIESKETLQNGIVMIFDYTGFTNKHARYYRFQHLRMFVSIFLYSYPIKMGKTFIINAPFVWLLAYNLLKPFLPTKAKQRLNFCNTDNLKPLHKHLSKDILPDWLGGSLNEEDAIDTDWIQSAFEKEDFYTRFNDIDRLY